MNISKKISLTYSLISLVVAIGSLVSYYLLSVKNTSLTEGGLLLMVLIGIPLFVGAISLLSIRFINREITSPLLKLKDTIDHLAKGQVKSIECIDRKDEIGQMEGSINKMIDGLKEKIVFSDEIGKGNHSIPFVPLSEEDILGNALLKMRANLNLNAENENKRSWATIGIANMGELLRKSVTSETELYDSIISFLVKYLDANQGALFIADVDLSTENVYLELKSCYAYNRKKYHEKRIAPGEGLIGQCYLEKETIYLTEVPQGYVTITSGLGGANPNVIILVPLKVNEQIYGILEIASFNVLEKYHVDFIERIAESIGSVIATMKINQHTKKLLEDSQMQAEVLRAQEEEMRQNMEELSASQEEMIKKEGLIQGLLNDSMKNEEALKEKLKEIGALNEMEQNRSMLIKVIDELPEKIFLKDEDGRLMLFNSLYAASYDEETAKKLIGTNDFDNFSFELATQYRQVELDIIKNNKPLALYEDFPDGSGEIRTVYSIKNPFLLPNGKVGILGYQIDVTDIKRLESKVKESENTIKEREGMLLMELRAKEEIINSQLEKIATLESSFVRNDN
jgi:HAMP domain-containing protein/PAS domain-containing protein